jgi:hypothetical protein
MPLRDHFRPPLDEARSWEELLGQWPAMIVLALARTLPPRYVAAPRVRLGAYFEIDVASYEHDVTSPSASRGDVGASRVATAAWAPPRPTFEVATDLSEQDEYEVRVYDIKRQRRLVAAIEIVSPANKDRPESRRAFVSKCGALLQQRVSVAIIDLVTTRSSNLCGDLLDLIGQADPSLSPEPPPLYSAACRWARRGDAWYFRAWAHPPAIGQPFPTLPLWLADDLAVPLDLEACYEEMRHVLRIP